MNTAYKNREYTPEQIAAMREWISDCEWPDLDQEAILELSDIQVLRGIERHVDGGFPRRYSIY